MVEFPREAYLQKLIARKHNGQIKIVTGARRCGKSYLLFNLFVNHLLSSGVDASSIIAVQLDDRKFKELRDPDACDAYVRKRISGEHCYIILDEVQLMDEFEDVLTGFMHIPNADVYATGSNSRFLSSDIITEFRGRGDQIHVHPLSFAEYHKAKGGDWDDDWNDYLTYGGMPFAASLTDGNEKAAYLQNLFRETYVRDIVERNAVRNVPELEELACVIASAVGSLTNPEKLARTFGSKKNISLSAPTIKNYLGYMEDAFLVSEAKQYDVKGKRYISTPLKFYFEDVGVRNALLNFRQHEETHLMENVIYNELRMRGYLVDVGVVHVTEGGKPKRIEIDFVANQGNRRYYVQSAFALPDERKRMQELRPLLATRDSFKKIVVVGGSHAATVDHSGVTTMGIKQFLLSANSLEA